MKFNSYFLSYFNFSFDRMDLEILEYERECYFEGEQKWSILGFLINGNGPLVEISTETDLKI